MGVTKYREGLFGFVDAFCHDERLDQMLENGDGKRLGLSRGDHHQRPPASICTAL